MKGWKLDSAINTTLSISVPPTFIHLQTNHNTNIRFICLSTNITIATLLETLQL